MLKFTIAIFFIFGSLAYASDCTDFSGIFYVSHNGVRVPYTVAQDNCDKLTWGFAGMDDIYSIVMDEEYHEVTGIKRFPNAESDLEFCTWSTLIENNNSLRNEIVCNRVTKVNQGPSSSTIRTTTKFKLDGEKNIIQLTSVDGSFDAAVWYRLNFN